MPDLIKDFYNYESLRRLAVDIESAYEPFQVDAFLESTMDETWENLELKDRLYQISAKLGEFLPADCSAAIGVIDKVVANYGTWLEGFVGFFPIFVEIHTGRMKKIGIFLWRRWRDIPHTHPQSLPCGRLSSRTRRV
jgi:hypothetical protein